MKAYMETIPEDVIDLGPDSIEEDTVLEADVAVGVVISKTFLVGKAISDAQISATSVTVAMMRAWRIKGDFRVNGKGPQRLEAYAQHALGEGPSLRVFEHKALIERLGLVQVEK